MPSQSKVEVHVYNYGLEIFVTGLAEDMGRSEGLCGNFDGNINNDFEPEYSSLPTDRLPRKFTERHR